MVAILSNRREVILGAVRAMYTDVAEHPEKLFHFPTGRAACRFVGYPGEFLAGVPETAVESFAGVGCPFTAEVIRAGDAVLDIGSGSGTDALIASRLVGQRGKVYGLDLTEAMLQKLEGNVARAGATPVEPLRGNAEEVPLPDESVDVATSNGVLNLVPDKARAIREIYRVLRPGGRVQIADVVLGRPASEACREDPKLWAECVVGATTESEYVRLFREAGFVQVEILNRLDYFSASSSAETREVAELFGAISIVLRARKGEPGAAIETDRPAAETSIHLHVPGNSILERGTVRADHIFDAGARGCGEVTPTVRRMLLSLAPGQVLGVRSEVPEAEAELGAWSRMAGHTFLGSEPADGTARLHFIRRKSA